jgi:predicted RNase H-like nuclease
VYYAGIDLAWTRRGRSGLAVLDQSMNIVHLSEGAYTDGRIADILSDFQPLGAVSVDSPLAVDNETGGRPCDSLLMRTRFHGHRVSMFATSRSYMEKTYGGVRGEELAAVLEARLNLKFTRDLCETFPTAICAGLFPGDYPLGYKVKAGRSIPECMAGADLLLRRIESLGIRLSFSADMEFLRSRSPFGEAPLNRNEYKAVEDQLDGLLCAINSYYWKRTDAWQVFGGGDNGFTVIAREPE